MSMRASLSVADGISRRPLTSLTRPRTVSHGSAVRIYAERREGGGLVPTVRATYLQRMVAVGDRELFVRFAKWVLDQHASGQMPTHKAVIELWTVAVEHPDTEEVAVYMQGVLAHRD